MNSFEILFVSRDSNPVHQAVAHPVREVVCLDLSVVTEIFRGSPQFLQANGGIVPRLDHDRFLANPFRFVHQSPPDIRRY
jgi:hypothetical protein